MLSNRPLTGAIASQDLTEVVGERIAPSTESASRSSRESLSVRLRGAARSRQAQGEPRLCQQRSPACRRSRQAPALLHLTGAAAHTKRLFQAPCVSKTRAWRINGEFSDYDRRLIRMQSGEFNAAIFGLRSLAAPEKAAVRDLFVDTALAVPGGIDRFTI